MKTCLLSLIVTLALLGQVGASETPPNIIVLLCDDLGYGDLECYGHPTIKTPNLNRLAAEGIRFSDCYSAAPVCSPSRVGLLTGRSPNRAGVYDWIPEAGKPTANLRHLVHMRQQEQTIAQFLRPAGYKTCQVGKWHCNSRFNQPTQPQPGDFGFDHWLATQNNAAPSHENPTNFVRNGTRIGPIKGYSCQLIVDEAIDWLSKDKNSSPFFLFVAFHEPHEPVASPESMVQHYLSSAKTKDQAQYFANVANIDDAVGRLIHQLDEMQLRENTIIIFTSDNGPETLNRYRSANRSYGQSGPLKGMKLHTTEAGFRVAGILNWKNHLPKALIGSVNETPITALDFLPTFCELANASIPADHHLDGTSITPILRNDQFERKKPLIWAYYNAINDARIAMRDGQWKVLAKLNGGKTRKLTNLTRDTLPLVRDAELTDFEIYNLQTDIQEQNNLASSNPELTKRLSKKLLDEYRTLVNESHVW